MGLNTKKQTFFRWSLVVYIIAVHLLLVFKTDFIQRVKGKLGISVVLNDHVKNMLTYHQSMDDSVPPKAVIFLGDSITQGLATAAIAPYAMNYGIGGENTEQLLSAIPTYKSLDRASVIFLMIGINDFGQGKEKGIIERFEKLDAALPHETPLVWSSVMPAAHPNINYTDVIPVNHAIKSLCEKRKNCTFIDTASFLLDPNGKMIPGFFTDGVHLTADGYKQWISVQKQTFQKVALASGIESKP